MHRLALLVALLALVSACGPAPEADMSEGASAPPTDHPALTDPSGFDAAYPPASIEAKFESGGEILNGVVYVAAGPGPHPVIGVIRLSPEGDLLVERKDLDPEPFDYRSTRSWDLIRDGEIVGRLRTPERFRASWFGDDEIWGAETDDLGVDYVVGYHVLPPGA